MPICPVAAVNGADALPKLRAPHADGDFDDHPAYHSGKHTSAPHQACYRGNLSLAL